MAVEEGRKQAANNAPIVRLQSHFKPKNNKKNKTKH